jgi:IclR family transcriptional regulator, acetate operon repressor
MNTSNAVKSAARLLDLLELFSTSQVPLGVSEISRRLAYPKSSCYMLLMTLVQRGLIVTDENRQFAMHASFSPEARAWFGGVRGRLMKAAEAPMKALVDSLDETAFLSVLRSDWMCEYVAKIPSRKELRLDAPVGAVRQPYGGSGGLVLLAYQPGEQLESWLARTPLQAVTVKTIVDPARLRRELAAIRTRGYGLSEGTNYPDASGVGAPVFGPHGTVIAAISVGAPSSRFQDIRLHAINETRRAAQVLSRALMRET